MLLVRLGFERLQLGVFDPCVLTLSDLVAAHGLVALDHDLTDWTKDLIAHPRAALFVQQLKANITIRGSAVCHWHGDFIDRLPARVYDKGNRRVQPEPYSSPLTRP